MTLGTSKQYLQQTLEHFDVNRVWTMSVDDFFRKYIAGEPLPLCGVRSFQPSDKHYQHTDNRQIYERILIKEITSSTHFICENMKDADENHLVCNGEAMLYKDEFDTWAWTGFVNYKKGLTCRQASLDPDSIFIKNRHQVPKSIFNLIWSKKIIGYVVEFTIYTVPVGLKREDVLIWEIRKY